MLLKAARFTTSPSSSRDSPKHNSSKGQPDCNTQDLICAARATTLFVAYQHAGHGTKKDKSHKFFAAVVVVVPLGMSAVEIMPSVAKTLAEIASQGILVGSSSAEDSLRKPEVVMTSVLKLMCSNEKPYEGFGSQGQSYLAADTSPS